MSGEMESVDPLLLGFPASSAARLLWMALKSAGTMLYSSLEKAIPPRGHAVFRTWRRGIGHGIRCYGATQAGSRCITAIIIHCDMRAQDCIIAFPILRTSLAEFSANGDTQIMPRSSDCSGELGDANTADPLSKRKANHSDMMPS
jgi:hypothetical protein